MTTKINPKQAGYLRLLPASNQTPTHSVSGPTTSNWNKLVKLGLAEKSERRLGASAGHTYRRTKEGDAALRSFDEGLSDNCRVLLQMVRDEPGRVPAAARGMGTLIDSGLVEFPIFGGETEPRLTMAAEDVCEELLSGKV